MAKRGKPGADLRMKRVYEAPARSDGTRILVDRLWPRGLSKESARIDFWARAISPSSELRRWYRHDAAKWPEFKKRFFAELDANPEGLEELRPYVASGTVTLLYGSKESRLNNAAALLEYLSSYR